MSYATIAQCANDLAFAPRVMAAYAKEGGVNPPDPAYSNMRWAIAADPSIEPAYESAVIANNPNPGGDPSVVTDGAILAAVSANPYTPPADLLTP